MSVVKVEKNRYIAEPLYQWDLNQVLEIRGLSLARIPEIHFRNETMSRAIVRQARMDSAGIITADIPNSLLQVPYKVLAYVCAYEGETFESLFKIEIPVTARKKPMDYTLVDDEEIYSFNALENQVVNALADMNNAIDRSEQNLEKAVAKYEAAMGNIENAKQEIINTLEPEDIGASPSDHKHGEYASEVVVEGDGNAVTEIVQSGNKITATKGGSFAASGHTHTPENIGAVNKNGDSIIGNLLVGGNITVWDGLNVKSSKADAGSVMQFYIIDNKIPVIAYWDQSSEAHSNVLYVDGGITYLGKPLSIYTGGTGATDAAGARVNLGIPFSGEVSYSAIDNITESGFYRVTGSTSTENGALIHFASNGMHRQLADFHLDGSAMMTRMRYSNGSWNAWDKVFDASQSVPIANGGTGATDKATARANLGAASEIDLVTLWTGDAGNGTTITLSESVWNFEAVYALIDWHETDWHGLVYGADLHHGLSVTSVDENKHIVTRAASILFSRDTPTTVVIEKCVSMTHQGGGNHPSAKDAAVKRIVGVRLK